MANPRNEAVRLLCKIEKDSSYSAITLARSLQQSGFEDRRDLSFAVSLIYGVLEHKITLDYNISLYLKSGIKKLNPTVHNILRVGACQILFADRIPVSAAVNEAVKSSKKLKVAFASGLINAVLHKIAEKGTVLPETDDKTEYLSIKYSVSPDIVRAFTEEYGIEKTAECFEAFSGRRPVFIRHNNVKCTGEELVSALQKDGVSVKNTDIEGCYEIENTGEIPSLEAFRKGYFHVQDYSSQLCVKVLGPKPGDVLIDCCSAPGGKSFTAAEKMEGRGKVYSADIYEHKTKLVSEGASRLGLTNIKTVCSDARELNKISVQADCVLCDVPCSGLGVIGRKPEIRYKSAEELSSLPPVQYEILSSCSAMVKPGGTLVYSTCTLNRKENSEVCDRFLSEHPSFSISTDGFYRSLTDKYIEILPEKEKGDGFFIAKFIRGI